MSWWSFHKTGVFFTLMTTLLRQHHSSGSQSTVSHYRGLGLIPEYLTWDALLWTWNRDRLYSELFSFPCQLLLHPCVILIYNLVLVQYAHLILQYQGTLAIVDGVGSHSERERLHDIFCYVHRLHLAPSQLCLCTFVEMAPSNYSSYMQQVDHSC
jgi:hypothetical protein